MINQELSESQRRFLRNIFEQVGDQAINQKFDLVRSGNERYLRSGVIEIAVDISDRDLLVLARLGYLKVYVASSSIVFTRMVLEKLADNASSVLLHKIEAGRFDVFLCHNNKDKSEVKKIGEQLKDQGILPWLDEWELQPGLPWQRLLERQIEQIKSAAVFVGKDGIGPWQHMELDAFLREFVKRGCPVIPVLLPEAPTEPELPIFLNSMGWVDFRRQDPKPLEQLLWGITGRRELK
jgi:hypothetical protein